MTISHKVFPYDLLPFILYKTFKILGLCLCVCVYTHVQLYVCVCVFRLISHTKEKTMDNLTQLHLFYLTTPFLGSPFFFTKIEGAHRMIKVLTTVLGGTCYRDPWVGLYHWETMVINKLLYRSIKIKQLSTPERKG